MFFSFVEKKKKKRAGNISYLLVVGTTPRQTIKLKTFPSIQFYAKTKIKDFV